MRSPYGSCLVLVLASLCSPGLAAVQAPAPTVGVGCQYSTVGDAVAAVAAGSTILLEGGRDFQERVTINKDLTIRGGYAGCASGSDDVTTVDGESGGIVVAVFGDVDVTLEDLEIVGGANPSGDGGGIAFFSATGGTLTLDNVVVANSTALRGGGIWLGGGVSLAAIGTSITDNTASVAGGGLRLYGATATFRDDSNINRNDAPVGGGVSGVSSGGRPPVLELGNIVIMDENAALTGAGNGGAVAMEDGSVVMGSAVFVSNNGAKYGGAIHLVRSDLTANGSGIDVNANGATEDGGAIWAGDDSTIDLKGVVVRSNQALGTSGDGMGGGMYLSESSCRARASQFSDNQASVGGAIFGWESSTLAIEAAPVGESTSFGVRFAENHAVSGGAVMLMDSSATIRRAVFGGNEADGGGGAMALVSASSVWISDSLFAENDSLGGGADAVSLSSSSTMEGFGLTFAFNDTAGASTGQAVSVSGDPLHSTLDLEGSIIWGHATSVDGVASISCSDVEGGWPGDGNLNTNPVFADPASSDYSLDATSPVVDRCASGVGSEDVLGAVRPWVESNPATPHDMGAFEYGAPLSLIFAGPFELGNTDGWSSTP